MNNTDKVLIEASAICDIYNELMHNMDIVGTLTRWIEDDIGCISININCGNFRAIHINSVTRAMMNGILAELQKKIDDAHNILSEAINIEEVPNEEAKIDNN